jgi:pantoate--beta-alanine ligase
MTQIIKSVDAWRKVAASDVYRSRTVGFVPTMGALHAGHRSLIDRSRSENQITVVSSFVNPTQFNEAEDYETYPRSWEPDLRMLNEAGADYLFSPEYSMLYPDAFAYRVGETTLSRELCGAFRPGHFEGVLTVVMKLLQLVKADKAYFGEKDYQQYLLIKGLADAFFVPTVIIPCATVREPDGLAMSSRNIRLSETGRAKAAEFAAVLRAPMEPGQRWRRLSALGKVDYLQERFGRRFGAISIEGVRLIDNVEINES